MKCYSRYLAQNAAIWLVDKVLKYCNHDTSGICAQQGFCMYEFLAHRDYD